MSATSVELSPRSQSLIMAAARAISMVLSVLTPIVLVRTLDQAEFGQYKQIFLLTMTVGAVLSFAMPNSLYHFVPKAPSDAARYLRNTMLAMLGAGAFATALVLLLANPAARFLSTSDHRTVILVALLTGVSIPASMLTISAQVERKARLAGLLLVGMEVLRNAAMVFAAAAYGTVIAVVWAAVLVAGFISFLAVLYNASALTPRGVRGWWSAAQFREQVRYCAPMATTGYVGLARDQFHAFYVATAFTPAEFAIYAVGTLNVPLIGQITQTLGEVLVLEASRHHAAGNQDELRRVWHRVVHVMALGIFPLFAALEVFAGDIITAFYGAEYAESAGIFRVYLLLLPVMIGLLTSPLLRATADVKTMLKADVISLAIMLACVPLMVRTLGPSGAVASFILGNAVFVMLTAPVAADRLESHVRSLFAGRKLLAILVISVAAMFAGHALVSSIDSPLLRVLSGGSIGATLCVVLLVRCGLVPEQELEATRRAGQRLLNRLWPGYSRNAEQER